MTRCTDKKLSELIEITHGYAFKGADFDKSDDKSKPIVLTPGNYTENGVLSFVNGNTKRLRGSPPKRFVFDEGDLTIVMTDLSSKMKILGMPAFVDKPHILHNQRIGRIVLKTDLVIARYIFFFLQTKIVRNKIKDTATGTMVRHTSPKRILENPISLPPLPEQQRIVAILDEAFAGIDAAIENTKRNLLNARELFESYLNDVFTQKGEGWVEKKLGDVCQLKSGTTVKKTLEQPVGDIPYVKVADMNLLENRGGIVTSSRFLDADDIGKKATFPVGTTIFPKRGGSIFTNKKRLTIIPICADLNVMGVIPSELIESEFLYFYFLSIDMRELGSGTAIPQINNYDIAPLIICFPTNSEQKRLAETFVELSTHTKKLESIYQQKLDALAELKQSILQKAFSGELTREEAAA